jgi:hypothetical protein
MNSKETDNVETGARKQFSLELLLSEE